MTVKALVLLFGVLVAQGGHHHSLDGVHTVLGLVEDDAVLALEHILGYKIEKYTQSTGISPKTCFLEHFILIYSNKNFKEKV